MESKTTKEHGMQTSILFNKDGYILVIVFKGK